MIGKGRRVPLSIFALGILLIGPPTGVVAWGGTLESCPARFSILTLPSDNVDPWLEYLGHLESNLNALKESSIGSQRGSTLHAIEKRIEATFDELGEFQKMDQTGRNALKLRLVQLNKELESSAGAQGSGAKSSMPRGAGSTAPSSTASTVASSVARSRGVSLSDLHGWEEIQPNVEYSLGSQKNADHKFKVIFKQAVLDGLLAKGFGKEARSALFTAAKKGMVGGVYETGIKQLTELGGSSKGIEVKGIGVAGPFRIFGCGKGNVMTFYFLGKHAESGGSPVIQKLREYCK